MVKQRMPVSAYLKAIFFLVAAAAALFAAAGTVAIPGFWAYLAIFAIVMIVSFAALDPDLLRERMTGRQEAAARDELDGAGPSRSFQIATTESNRFASASASTSFVGASRAHSTD